MQSLSIYDKFQTAYSPRREMSLDESLLLWKGRISWVQCIRTKAARFGIKSYELCEAVSRYVLNILIYTGKGTTETAPVASLHSSTAKIVITLMQNISEKGTRYLWYFYYTVDLCKYLKSRATDVVATVNRRRQNTPSHVKTLDERRIVRSSVVGRHRGDVSVTAWKDVKLVTTISTYHNADLIEGRRAGRSCLKPVVVQDHNMYMGVLILIKNSPCTCSNRKGVSNGT